MLSYLVYMRLSFRSLPESVTVGSLSPLPKLC
jgi:hypothetical protein